MKTSRYNLQKLVDQLQTYDYTVRYEKGHFQSGFCILEDKKVVIINKFFDLRARIESLDLIIAQISSGQV